MKKYMAVFLGSPAAMNAFRELPEAERKQRETAGVAAWQQWVKNNQAAIADMGSPLGKTKRVSKDGIADTRNELSAWTVVHAESQEAAAKLFENHPHFTIFPGDRIEVMECLPIPGM